MRTVNRPEFIANAAAFGTAGTVNQDAAYYIRNFCGWKGDRVNTVCFRRKLCIVH